MVMFVTMMIVMVMGNLLIETEADAPPQPSPFKTCYPGCVLIVSFRRNYQRICGVQFPVSRLVLNLLLHRWIPQTKSIIMIITAN